MIIKFAGVGGSIENLSDIASVAHVRVFVVVGVVGRATDMSGDWVRYAHVYCVIVVCAIWACRALECLSIVV